MMMNKGLLRIGVLGLFLLTVLMAGVPLFGMGGQEEEPVKVVASTSWVAALAYGAGAAEVHVLAPYEMQHPPEYELRPSDLTAVAEAEVIIYAGYETMVDKLKEVAENGSIKTVQVRTDNDPENLKKAITAIGAALGREAQAEAEVRRIQEFYTDWRRELKDLGWFGAPAAVHRFQEDVGGALGFRIQESFGPAPLEAPAIAALTESGIRLVIDNSHNPVAEPLRKTLADKGKGSEGADKGEVPVVALANFPQDAEEPELWSVLEENRRILREALESAEPAGD